MILLITSSSRSTWRARTSLHAYSHHFLCNYPHSSFVAHIRHSLFLSLCPIKCGLLHIDGVQRLFHCEHVLVHWRYYFTVNIRRTPATLPVSGFIPEYGASERGLTSESGFPMEATVILKHTSQYAGSVVRVRRQTSPKEPAHTHETQTSVLFNACGPFGVHTRENMVSGLLLVPARGKLSHDENTSWRAQVDSSLPVSSMFCFPRSDELQSEWERVAADAAHLSCVI